MHISTKPRRTIETRYRDDPTGFTVILADGREVEVKAYQDTRAGRRLRCRGVRRWVRGSEVVAIRYWMLSIAEASKVGARELQDQGA